MSQIFSQFLALGPFPPMGIDREYNELFSKAAHTLPMRLLMGTVILSFALYGIWVTTRPVFRNRGKSPLKEIAIKLRWGLAFVWFLCVSMMALAICIFINIGG